MAARLLLCVLLFAVAHTALVQAARAQTSHPIDIAELNVGDAPATLAIGDPLAVFAFVLRNVPERAQVLPTENYYYFRFVHNGAPYTGNIRLAAADRDSGKVHFAYGRAPTDRRPSPRVRHLVLDASHGAVLTRLSRAGVSPGISGQGGHVRAQRSGCGEAARRTACGRRNVSRRDLRRIGGAVFPGVQFAAEDIPLSARRNGAAGGRMGCRG